MCGLGRRGRVIGVFFGGEVCLWRERDFLFATFDFCAK